MIVWVSGQELFGTSTVAPSSSAQVSDCGMLSLNLFISVRVKHGIKERGGEVIV